ncbi:hypothetical protein HXX02_06850 [Microbulbifer elongatus]|uniref:Probable zinc-binding domain-containing protein n=1 Tax=Microbulbifer elongatus TaxID=86173 RepID=A0ABT1NZ88_9GAMM|nr:zinc-ribbon domain-containing protein [Microbulbifer elongatus]MCQ3829158.1 hypothetical protein [Microbulbifer elongatus]
MIVPADKSKWSESSRNSYLYDSHIDHYADIPYNCYKCGDLSVFTALEQKEAFEVRKCYVWQRRTLCSSCYKELKKLKAAIKDYEKMWASEDESSKSSAPFVGEWLSALKQVHSFGKHPNGAMITHLEKHLGKNA